MKFSPGFLKEAKVPTPTGGWADTLADVLKYLDRRGQSVSTIASKQTVPRAALNAIEDPVVEGLGGAFRNFLPSMGDFAKSVGKGGFAGANLGALGGAGLGLAAGDDWTDAITGGIVGAGLGGLGGAGIGALRSGFNPRAFSNIIEESGQAVKGVAEKEEKQLAQKVLKKQRKAEKGYRKDTQDVLREATTPKDRKGKVMKGVQPTNIGDAWAEWMSMQETARQRAGRAGQTARGLAPGMGAGGRLRQQLARGGHAERLQPEIIQAAQAKGLVGPNASISDVMVALEQSGKGPGEAAQLLRDAANIRRNVGMAQGMDEAFGGMTLTHDEYQRLMAANQERLKQQRLKALYGPPDEGVGFWEWMKDRMPESWFPKEGSVKIANLPLFREKRASYIGNALTGAALGGLGGAAMGYMKPTKPVWALNYDDANGVTLGRADKENPFINALKGGMYGALGGAGLGLGSKMLGEGMQLFKGASIEERVVNQAKADLNRLLGKR